MKLCVHVVALALSVLVAGCSAVPRPQTAPSAAPASAPLDASYDWHVLMIMPLGTLLKASPVPLHEVLQFDDAARPGAAAEDKDCYTIDAPPRFVERRLDQYLLCFDHDKLQHIEASVPVPAGDAPHELARACASWLHNAASDAPRNDCEGLEGVVRYSARLQPATDAAATLTVTLAAVPTSQTPDVAPEAAH